MGARREGSGPRRTHELPLPPQHLAPPAPKTGCMGQRLRAGDAFPELIPIIKRLSNASLCW